MRTRRLGHTDMHISALGFGAWAIGGPGWAFSWGSQDDRDSVAAIREALELGVNWIDTAPVYGLGHSEEVVAKALEGVIDRPYVFTKCGRVWDDNRQIGKRLTADSVRAECEASLKRLKVERIDLYQIHWPEPDEQIEEGWATLEKLQTEGKVRWIGVSNFSVAQMERASKIAPIASLQPNYSLLMPGVQDEVLPYCGKKDIGVIAYSPMGSGMLTGTMTRARIASLPQDDWRRNNRHYNEPLLTRSMKLVELVNEIAASHGRTPGEVALAWVLRLSTVTGAIVGVRRPGQLRELVGAADLHLTLDDDSKLARFLADHPV
jgi:aryl-alcohol dehydrogenase-like predicted oxidoreductase